MGLPVRIKSQELLDQLGVFLAIPHRIERPIPPVIPPFIGNETAW